MNNTRSWLRWQLVRLQARWWLGGGHRASRAASAMFHLNRKAAAGWVTWKQKQFIYDLKTSLCRDFYNKGYARIITTHHQHLPCWRCEGTGVWAETGEPCRKCDGTKHYRTNHLYRLTFEVGEDVVTWHQPVERLGMVPEIPQNGVVYTVTFHKIENLPHPLYLFYLAVVYEYLVQNRLPVPATENLVQSIRRDWAK